MASPYFTRRARHARSALRGAWVSARVSARGAALVTAMVALVLASCARPRSNDPGGIRASDVLTIDEISKSQSQNAYDAVRRLRPAFLATRGPTTLLQRQERQVVVYLDGRRYGDVESLRTITTDGIFEVRYLSPNQAQQRWGMNHAAGVIHVVTMSGRSTTQP